jgi:hypothetical protein
MTWFDSLDSVAGFAGDDYETPVSASLPAARRFGGSTESEDQPLAPHGPDARRSSHYPLAGGWPAAWRSSTRSCRPPLRLSALRSREPRAVSAPQTIAPIISTIITTIKIVIARPISTPGPYPRGLREKPASSPGASLRAAHGGRASRAVERPAEAQSAACRVVRGRGPRRSLGKQLVSPRATRRTPTRVATPASPDRAAPVCAQRDLAS